MRLIFHTRCELCEGVMTTFSSAFINLPIKLLAVRNFHQLIVLTIILQELKRKQRGFRSGSDPAIIMGKEWREFVISVAV